MPNGTNIGGLSKLLYFNKSPLGDLGVYQRKVTISTDSMNLKQEMKNSFFIALCTAFALLSFASCNENPPPPNIVLIYADDLGYGDVSCYGAKRISTPNIDRLAAQGLRFTNAHSTSSTCTPSRYSLLTGEYAWRKSGTGVLTGDAPAIIGPGRTTIASVLRKAGYTTGVVGKWHLGLGPAGGADWNGEITSGPMDIGFDYNFIIPATGDRVPCVFVENRKVVNLDPADPITVSFDKPILAEPTGRDHPELLKMHPSHGHDMTIINGISRIGYMSGGKSARWIDEDIADVITGKAVRFIEEEQKTDLFFFTSQLMTFMSQEFLTAGLPEKADLAQGEMSSLNLTGAWVRS